MTRLWGLPSDEPFANPAIRAFPVSRQSLIARGFARFRPRGRAWITISNISQSPLRQRPDTPSRVDLVEGLTVQEGERRQQHVVTTTPGR
jgi:hypothetical protein